MFTDIVGYTALMGENEASAYQLLKKNRQVQKPLIEKHDGKWLKEMGDGVLASFQTVSDSVYCAIEIQEACLKEPDLKLRIGIHLGEVIVEDADVFGDGVNIASRLEPLAPAGGIFVSESVYRNIQNKEGINAEFVREETLKNVKYPIRIYEVKVDGVEVEPQSAIPESVQPREHDKKSNLVRVIIISLAIIITFTLAYFFYPKQGKEENITQPIESEIIDKSIAILPFSDLSPEGDQGYFSDGMTLEITNHLYKIEGLQVTSNLSVMRYKNTELSMKDIAKELGVANVLGGSVRKSGDSLRISVDLINGSTEERIWSETYDRKLPDVFAIHSDVALLVVKYLRAAISPDIIERMEQMPTENMEAYDLYLKASNFAFTATLNSQDAIGWLNQAILLDSNFARAYALLGNAAIFQAGFTQDKNPNEVGPKGKAYLEKSLLLDPMDATAHILMASYSIWYEKDFNKAEINYRIAKELAPSDENSYASYLDLLLAEGRFQEAIPIGAKLLEIAGNNPANWGRDALLWAFNDEKEKMYESIKQARKAPSDNILAYTESARALLIQKQYNHVLEILDLSSNAQAIPRSMGLKSIAYYQIGDIENHNKELDSLIQRSRWTAGGSPSFYTAMVYASKGNTNESFKWLEKSYQDNEIELYWLKVEPEFESLHDDLRWQEMLDNIGFPD